MQNFNTNQTRHFYVAGSVVNAVNDQSANLAIAPKTTANGEMFFSYKNADGLLTRSDTFDPKKIISLKKTVAADMDVPIIGHKIELNSENVDVNNLSQYTGKAISCMVTVHQVYDYDEATSLTYTATVIGNSTNLASAAALYKALAVEIAKVVPELYVKVYAGTTVVTKKTAVADITGSPTSVILIPQVQKYVRGKLAAETATLSVAFRLHDGEDTVWGKDTTDTVANLGGSLTPAVISSVYVLADLEYFALGERGDMYRGFHYPNNWETTYAIDLSKTYDVVSIEYYWNGDAENVQKSPRMIQIACEVSGSGSQATSDADELYDAVAAAMAGVASS